MTKKFTLHFREKNLVLIKELYLRKSHSVKDEESRKNPYFFLMPPKFYSFQFLPVFRVIFCPETQAKVTFSKNQKRLSKSPETAANG